MGSLTPLPGTGVLNWPLGLSRGLLLGKLFLNKYRKKSQYPLGILFYSVTLSPFVKTFSICATTEECSGSESSFGETSLSWG